jgi:type IX secretion system PorP/SprF family membrane protein
MKIISLVVLLFTVTVGFSQSRQFYNQYMLNPGFLNPANMDVFTKYGTIFMSHYDYTSQDNSASNFALLSHYNYRPHLGFSGLAVNDNFGGYNQMEIAGNVAYKHFTRSNGGMSFSYGMRLGFTQNTLNASNLYYRQLDDPTLTQPGINKFGLNLGVGFSMVTPDFDLNVSLPGLLGNRLPSSPIDTTFKRSMFDMKSNNLFISTGYKFRWDNGYYVFYPTVSFRSIVGAPINISADVNFLLNQLIWLGAGYRTDNTIVASAGVFLDLGWRFVYTYNNAALTKHFNTGPSHEISIGYARTIPENPFTYRKFTKTNGDTKKKKHINIKLPKIKIFKKIKGRMKYD